MAKKIDVFDLLPQEAIEKIDDMGYEFLKENGYNVDGAKDSPAKQKEIKANLKKDGKSLIYFSMIDKETKAILFWFELCKGKKTLATSKGIKFLPREEEENGQGKSEERPKGT